MTSQTETCRDLPMYQITYQVTWFNRNGTSNETEVSVRAATHEEGKKKAVEVMQGVVGSMAYLVTPDSPQFYPEVPVRVEMI